MPDPWDLASGRTYAMQACVPRCPPLVSWPAKNLVQGTCPVCGCYEGTDGRKAARVLRARRLVAGV